MNSITPEAFRAAFVPRGAAWQSYDRERPLLQLGLPSPSSVVLWLLPRRGEVLECSVRVVELPGARQERSSVPGLSPARVEISGLEPGTQYHLEVTLADRGSAEVQRLTASTAAVSGRFSFLVASCLQPFAGGRDGVPTYVMNQSAHALQLFRDRASAPPGERPAFALSLGDQVYVDDDASHQCARALLHGSRSERLRYAPEQGEDFFETLYRASFSLEPFAAALRTLPTAMMWDDHEIRDGWGSQGDEEATENGIQVWRRHAALARRYFAGFQGLRNPMQCRGAQGESFRWSEASELGARLTASAELDFCFEWGELGSFFVMDQRSFRNARERRVTSDAQLERIARWLETRNGRPTVFVLGSPLPLTLVRRFGDYVQALFPSRWDDIDDSWWSSAAKAQRDRLLALLRRHFAAHPLHRLLVLSGDVHFSELLELADPNGTVFGHEIVSSGLAQTDYFRVRGRASQSRSALAHGLTSRGLGRFLGPAFAEVFVEANAEAAPRVGVTFHTAVTEDGKQLANTTGERLVRLDLPLRPLDLQKLGWTGLFARFTHADPARRAAEAAADGFDAVPGR